MTASQLLQIANPVALAGWLILAAAVFFRNEFWRDLIAGRAIPVALALAYAALIFFFFGTGKGGFNALADVQALFTSDWLALAGWVHYLAFDLFIGSWIAKRVMELGLPRVSLIIILPFTFMFGPIGLVAFEITKLALTKVEVRS